jgi:ABC-type branched-subunit amino acid transport system substrate-binding protein
VRHCLNDEGKQYYQTIVGALAVRGKPDAVVLAARTQEATCLGLALRRRWPGLPLIAGDGVYLDEHFFRVIGDEGEGMHLVAFWHRNTPGVRSRQFADAFKRETGLEARHGDAVFADATMLAATAIRSGARTRAEVVEYLRSLGTTRPAFEGVSGPISFAPGARRPLWMTRVVGRSSELVSGI